MDAFVCDTKADALQKKYDDLIAKRAKVIAAYDLARDGDIRKQIAYTELRRINHEIMRVEQLFDELF